MQVFGKKTAIFVQKASKFARQPGAKHHKIAISVVDVLQRRLHAEPLFKTASPCEFERIFRTLIESGVLPRQSALVATVGVSHPQLGIAVAAVVAVGVSEYCAMQAISLSEACHTFCSPYTHQAQLAFLVDWSGSHWLPSGSTP